MENLTQKTQLRERDKDVLSYWQTLAKESSTRKLVESWQDTFKDKESRYAYIDDFLDSYLGMQIRVLREQRGWTQTELGERASMNQTRISLLESMEYSGWSLDVLRRFAKAFELRLVVKFEDFGSYLKDYFEFDRPNLERRSFSDDIIFSDEKRNKALREVESASQRRNKRKAPPDASAPYLYFMYPIDTSATRSPSTATDAEPKTMEMEEPRRQSFELRAA